MKKAVFYSLILCTFFASCKKKDASISEADLYQGSSWYIDDANNHVYGVHKNGSFVICKTTDGLYDASEIVFKNSSSSEPIYIEMVYNKPNKVYINNNILLFQNYNFDKQTVDIALIRNDGTIETFFNVFIAELNTYKNLQPKSDYFNVALMLKWAGYGLSVATCATSIVGTLSTGGALAPVAAISCGLTLVDLMQEINPTDDVISQKIGESSKAWGYVSSSVGCASKDITDCASLLLSISSDVTTFATNYFNSNSQNIQTANNMLANGATTYSINGNWLSSEGIGISISGSTAIFYSFSSSWQYAANAGFVSIGSVKLKNISKTNSTTWNCLELWFHWENTNSNVTDVFWSYNGTISMSSNGNSISVYSSATYNGVTQSGTTLYTRQ
jgi:hypothetical protein